MSNKVIGVAGTIGAGKSQLTRLLSEELGYMPLYENADDPLLENFYANLNDENESERWSYNLQLHLLGKRFQLIKDARHMNGEGAVLDRLLDEDKIFLETLYERGEITELERAIYHELHEQMMEEVHWMPRKTPDLVIFLNISFEKELEHIFGRGRGYEQDKDLIDYYKHLYDNYQKWYENYDRTPTLTIDMDKMDFVNNKSDAEQVVSLVKDKLRTLQWL